MGFSTTPGSLARISRSRSARSTSSPRRQYPGATRCLTMPGRSTPVASARHQRPIPEGLCPIPSRRVPWLACPWALSVNSTRPTISVPSAGRSCRAHGTRHRHTREPQPQIDALRSDALAPDLFGRTRSGQPPAAVGQRNRCPSVSSAYGCLRVNIASRINQKTAPGAAGRPLAGHRVRSARLSTWSASVSSATTSPRMRLM